MTYLRQVLVQDADGNLAVLVDPSTPAVAWGQKGLRVIIGPTDLISNIPVMIDYDHHQLHEGEVFHYDFYVASLASAASKDIRLVVPNITIPADNTAVGLCPHVRIQVETTNLATYLLYEGTTFTANGNQRTPIAMERNGTYTPKLQLWEDPTVNVLGTQIDRHEFMQAAGGLKNGGGVADTSQEFVLKNNTSYHMRVTSGAAGCKVSIDMHWYEDLGV